MMILSLFFGFPKESGCFLFDLFEPFAQKKAQAFSSLSPSYYTRM